MIEVIVTAKDRDGTPLRFHFFDTGDGTVVNLDTSRDRSLLNLSMVVDSTRSYADTPQQPYRAPDPDALGQTGTVGHECPGATGK